jgi:hypothetical protein
MTGNFYTCDCTIKTNKGRKCKCSNSSSPPSSPVATNPNLSNDQEAIKEANQGYSDDGSPNELSKEQKDAPVSINQSMNKTFKANNASSRLNATPNLEGKNITNPLLNKSLLKSANTKLNNKRLTNLKQYKGVNPLTRRKTNKAVTKRSNASKLNAKATSERIKSFLEDDDVEKPRIVNKNVVEAQAMLAQLRNKSDDAALAAKQAAADLKTAKGKENAAKARKAKEAADAEAKRAYIQKVNAEQAVREASINRGSGNANILASAEKASPASAAVQYNAVTETPAERTARQAKQAEEFKARALANRNEQMRRLKAARDPAYLAAERKNAASRNAQRRGTVSLTRGGRRTRRSNKRRTVECLN